jgi:DNA ligase (NAD+)
MSRTIADIPQRWRAKARTVFEIRGEVYMAKADFAALNARLMEEARPGGKAPPVRQPAQRRRRIAAPEGRKRHRQRPLRFLAHGWGAASAVPAGDPVRR